MGLVVQIFAGIGAVSVVLLVMALFVMLGNSGPR